MESQATNQRRINLVWEFTQASIAVGIVGATIFESVTKADVGLALRDLSFLVVGFYFGRTNHARFIERPARPDASVEEE